MIRCTYVAAKYTGGIMANFAIVSLEYAKLQTTSGWQREYVNENGGVGGDGAKQRPRRRSSISVRQGS
jgi:hypothetical protein